jgi:NAD(P)-dependent dehydrogenase (short-subunit alcohol dehydrogenase family)
VVLGGYGNFGARICQALAQEGGLAVVIAERNGARVVMAKKLARVEIDTAGATPCLVFFVSPLSSRAESFDEILTRATDPSLFADLTRTQGLSLTLHQGLMLNLRLRYDVR